MRAKVTDRQIDQLIAQRLPHVVETQILADSAMRLIESDAPISPTPWYHSRTSKLRSRIYIKVRRYLDDHSDWDLETAVNKVDDLAGGRFLVYYIDDIEIFYSYIRTKFKERNDIKLVGGCRNCISNPKQSGFRALMQDISFQIEPQVWFPFELQIMTFLAHDWAQKQHIVYENREDIPTSIHGVFLELSETLHRADQTFATIRTLLKEFTDK